MADKSPSNPMKRVSRACLHCRSRKSKCDLDASGGTPPCERCKKEGRECVLGSSNRGGSRIRKKNINNLNTDTSSPAAPTLGSIGEENEKKKYALPQPFPSPAAFSGSHLSPQDPRLGVNITPQTINESVPMVEADDDTASTADSAIIAPTIPRNPSDAWQLLKDVANRESEQMNNAGGQYVKKDAQTNGTHSEARGSINGVHAGVSTYRLVREGYLNPDIIHMLVGRYAEYYHPYLPLVPRKYFDPANLDAFAVIDKHLLTAVLTISSKDLVDQENVHMCCSRYMHDLISGIAAGHDCDVEAVEALLLWQNGSPKVYEIGLRQLVVVKRIEARGCIQESVEEARIDGRKRLAWANCYVSDRLISVRIGRAFWSRGPGPMTGLSHQDFPSLQPLSPGDEDYAKIFQAILDLTQLYSNVHDVLYSGMRTSGQMVMMGDYVKYVDEFRMAIARWNRRWGNLHCSSHIKATLQMSYEYLCLYTNAFVFQAAISQAISNKPKGQADAPHALRDHLRQAFSNIGSMPDARFIWASLAAAKGFLTILTTVDPVKHLRYMPLRFYLYSIYSAVFLYKARSYGVMDAREESQVRNLIYQTVDLLRRASVSSQDPGSRYARLLELLWMKKTAGSLPPVPPSPHGSDARLSTGSISLDAGGYMQFSPANDFSWLDLEAVGEYVSGDPMSSNANLLAPMVGFQAPTSFMPQAQEVQWQQPNPSYNWQFDLQGNLLF